MEYNKITKILNQAESELENQFKEYDNISRYNQFKVMSAFKKYRVSEPMLHGTTGYGYDDIGRDTLEKLYAEVFSTEDAIVRHNIVSGTQAISTVLYGLLRPGDTLYSVSGTPYDTLEKVIGIKGFSGDGSLKDFGINYKETALNDDGSFNLKIIKETIINDPSIKLIYIQRSRGYTSRKTISLNNIKELCSEIKKIKNITVFTDNCYGEFAAKEEPTNVGVDIIAGSLIKNPGGGLAESGGYIAGKKDLVEKCAYRLTAVGIGKECGASLSQLRLMFQGFFMAPHITAQAIKTAVLASYLFEKAGYTVSPKYYESREDIVQTITFYDKNKLIKFCETIQEFSPVDSYVRPEPWPMPGYECDVIMAAGCFVSGASIELSADAPIKPPFTAYFQGGLSYESGSITLTNALNKIEEL